MDKNVGFGFLLHRVRRGERCVGRLLYAHITIQGDPFNPLAPYNDLWTDPVTGFYSVTLAEGITYTFNVNAWAGGYSCQPNRRPAHKCRSRLRCDLRG
jgi:hypothetical protein